MGKKSGGRERDNAPFFSICIPAYNAQQHLAACIASVAKQTFDSWQIVVIDDGSSDGTATLLENHELAVQGRLVFRSTPNAGPYLARRRAFELAEGEVLLCMDSDDEFMHEEVLERVYTMFAAHPEADMVMFNGSTSRSGAPLFSDYSLLEGHVKGHLVEWHALVNMFSSTFAANNVWNKAFRAECLPETYYDKRLVLNEDRLQVMELLDYVHRTYVINEPFYYYRSNEASTTHNAIGIELRRQTLFIESEVYGKLEGWGIPVEDWACSIMVPGIIGGGLHCARETVADRDERWALYDEWLSGEASQAALAALAGKLRRPDRMLFVELCQHRAYRSLDVYLRLMPLLRKALGRG